MSAIVQVQAGQPPPNYGYLQACWTVALLLCHLRQRSYIEVSATTLRQALKQAGFPWTRRKLVLPRRRDPLADEKRARLAQALADPRATVLAEEECDLHQPTVLRATRQRTGQHLHILTPGKNRERGALAQRLCDPRRNRSYWLENRTLEQPQGELDRSRDAHSPLDACERTVLREP